MVFYKNAFIYKNNIYIYMSLLQQLGVKHGTDKSQHTFKNKHIVIFMISISKT